MHKDKLDVLLDILKKNPQKYRYPIKDMLVAVGGNHDAFLFLFENLSEEDKPKINQGYSQYKSYFLDAIIAQDEKTFNHYFFKYCSDVVDIEEIRSLYFKLPNNEKLKNFLEEKDNPQSIDKIVEKLSVLWSQEAKQYQENYQRYLPKLQKLALLKGNKSRAADYFSYWGRKMIDNKGIDYFFDFCGKINLEPFIFCINTKKNFSIDLNKADKDTLEKLMLYGEKMMLEYSVTHKFQFPYSVVEKISGYYPILGLLKNLSTQNPPKEKEFVFIWDNNQEYIKDILKKQLFIRGDKSIEELLKALKTHTQDIGSQLGIHQKDIDDLISFSQYAKLNQTLIVNEENKSIKKVKI